MRVSIEIRAGSKDHNVRKRDVQENIDALSRSINNRSLADKVLIMDTISILEAIQEQLPI